MSEPRRWKLRAAHSTLSSGARAWPIVVGGPTFGSADDSVVVVEAASVEAELVELRDRHRVLLDGMRERGFGVGRNPDGDDQTPETALLVIDEYRVELERLRNIETAARAVLAVGWRLGPFEALREVLEEAG